MKIIDIASADRFRPLATDGSSIDCTKCKDAGPANEPVAARPMPDARSREARAPRYTSYPAADRFIEAFGPGDHALFAAELDALASFLADGYVRIEEDATVVTGRGRRSALRPIAAEFDRHLRDRRERDAFSRVL